MILIGTIYFHVFIKEKEEREGENSEEFTSISEVVSSFKGYWKNKNLRFLLMFLFFSKIGVLIIFASYETRLI